MPNSGDNSREHDHFERAGAVDGLGCIFDNAEMKEIRAESRNRTGTGQTFALDGWLLLASCQEMRQQLIS